MKKLITVAALLAAGTALSNAAQVIGINSSTTTVSLNGNSNTEANISVTENATVNMIDGSSINNLTTITLDIANGAAFSVTNNAKLPYNCTNKTYSVGVTLGTGSSFNVGRTLYFGSQNGSYSGIALTANVHFTAGSSITAGTLSTVAAAGGTSQLNISVGYVEDMLLSAYTWTLISTTNGFQNYTAEKIALSDVASLNDAGYENVGVVSSADALSAGQYGLVLADNKLTFKSVSPIPEPSAFGLLAGIGALALVAARRRRK